MLIQTEQEALQQEARRAGGNVKSLINRTIGAQQKAGEFDDEFAREFWTARADKFQSDVVFYARQAWRAAQASQIQVLTWAPPLALDKL